MDGGAKYSHSEPCYGRQVDRMDSLVYEDHLFAAKKLYGIGDDLPSNPTMAKFVEEQAQAGHALVVWQALQSLFEQVSLGVPNSLKNDQARIYLLHGAGRRLGTMFHCFRAIVHTAHEGRKEPLSHEEQQNLSRDLNLIYMNLRGVLDNFAASFLYERAPNVALDRLHIDLFSKIYRKEVPAFSEIKDVVMACDDWNREVKSRRDPVAHRIPLYLPPAILTSEEGKKYRELEERYWSELAKQQFDKVDATSLQWQRLGRFHPVFLHHPEESPFPLYPTIPSDLANVVRIGRAVVGALTTTA